RAPSGGPGPLPLPYSRRASHKGKRVSFQGGHGFACRNRGPRLESLEKSFEISFQRGRRTRRTRSHAAPGGGKIRLKFRASPRNLRTAFVGPSPKRLARLKP